MNTTIDIFGDELHRYSIADGIRDKNVLGFDPYQVLTFKDRDIRKIIALHETNAKDESEALSDEKKKKIYDYFMKANMTEIEACIPSSQYWTQEHQMCVVNDIVENWITISRNYQFHAIFASSSIPEAIAYYRLFKQQAPHLKVAALFDPNIDNVAGFEFKEDGLVEVIEDYNARYAQNFSLPTFAKMKKDIAARLAHKKPYQRINPEQQIDLLIVVNQMLTGFDSKWINTLYLDKVIEYESIIQAFSRTNRLFGADKPFGTIKYYRKPHTMKDNIEKAVKLYSGDKVFGLFADKLPKNIEMLNSIFNEIKLLFENAGVANFERLPENDEEKAQFALLFNRLNAYLEAAKVQGLSLKQQDYSFKDEKGKKFTLSLVFDETTYFILLQRYKELTGNSGGTKPSAIPYDIKGYITEIDTGKIDNDYMNSRFQKYLKLLNNKAGAEQMQAVKEELHKTFATLNQEEQKYANIFLHDIESGNVEISENLDLRAYINRYIIQAKNDAIAKIATALGVDESKLREMINLYLNEDNINEYGRFDELRKTINKPLAKEYFEKQEGTTLSQKDANLKAAKLLREFILRGEFEA